MSRQPSLLLLYSLPGETAGTVSHHLEALATIPGFSSRILNLAWSLPAALDLNRFDVILIHYTLMASEDAKSGPLLLSRDAVARIAAATALKGVFVQDEHRNIRHTIQALRELKTGILFTCVPHEQIEAVYPESALFGVHKVNVLTGYMDPSLLHRSVVPYQQRRVDVGYRARKVAFWLGALAREKWTIAGRFEHDARDYGLACDISTREEDRIYGEAWLDFLSSCKAVLGTESGASAVDFDGSLRAAVDAAVAADPDVDFDNISNRFLRGFDGQISMAQISPRCFEAAAARTLMILYEGQYSGRLQAWRHFVPLKKDHSNMAEVVAVLRDDKRATEIITRAYNECALAPENSYEALQAVVRDAVLTVHRALTEAGGIKGYDDGAWTEIVAENTRSASRLARLRRAGGLLTAAAAWILPKRTADWLRTNIVHAVRRILFGR